MALWMTVEQEILGLAVVLLVFFCAVLCDILWNLQGVGKDERTVLALVFIGLMAGVCRMEWEQRVIAEEEAFVECSAMLVEETEQVTGIVETIETTEFGIRLTLRKCMLKDLKSGEDETSKRKVRRMYVYLNETDELKIGMHVCVTGIVRCLEKERNPGGFDFRSYCLAKGICGSVKGETAAIIDPRYFWMREELRQIGLILGHKIEQIAAPEDVGILKAVLLGDKDDLDSEVYELYRKNGISHVLAISGLHVSVIGMGLWRGFRTLGAGYWSSGAAAFLMLFCFGYVAGFGPSVVRAICMMGISFLAGICGRTYDLPSAVCVPALLLMIRNPYVLTQASFQLSFLAVLAIFFPGEYLAKRWKLTGFWKNLWTSVSIQLVTTPVILWHSFEFPVFGILLNLLVVPLMTYVLVSAILGVAGSFLWIPLGVGCLGGAHVILLCYRRLCEMMENIYGAYQILGRPSYAAMIWYFICLMIGIQIASKKKTGVFLWILGTVWLLPMETNGLLVTFLDVGQGDGIVLQAGGRTMLVDCGSSQKTQVGSDLLIPFFKSCGIDHVDVAVVTHGDQDHINGVRELLLDEDCGISIGRLLMPGSGLEDEACMELKKLAEERGILVCVIWAESGEGEMDEIWAEFQKEGVEIRCLHPQKNANDANRNDGSLVLEVQYGLFRLLLTGDVEESGEHEMAESEILGPVTVLKAAHHGSASSTSQEFLDRTMPSCVIFSYGAGNRYGHPADEVMKRCRESGADIWETAKSGAVIVWTDGERMRAEGWLDR